jgi:hypothetical protein
LPAPRQLVALNQSVSHSQERVVTEEQKGEWTLIALEAETGPRIYRIRSEPPAGVKKEVFSESVIIEWKFGEGLPDQATSIAMFAFERHMEPIDNHTEHSLLVHVYTGSGIKEWCYYTKSYDEFMAGLNVALAGKPRFPIEILHDHDPTWTYWSGIKDYAHGKG